MMGGGSGLTPNSSPKMQPISSSGGEWDHNSDSGGEHRDELEFGLHVDNQLDQIPEDFFHSEFTCMDPAILAMIDLGPDLCSDIQLGKLSHWLDIVEIELIEEVSQRKWEFFDALSNLEKLRADVNSLCGKMSSMQELIQSCDENLVVSGMKVPQLWWRRWALQSIHKKLKLMRDVQHTSLTVQALVNTGDYMGAINLIANSKNLFETSLHGVQALKDMGMKLQQMISSIDTQMQHEFVRNALPALKPANTSPPPLDYSLMPLVVGLLRLQKLQVALNSYQEQFTTILESTITSDAVSNQKIVPNTPEELATLLCNCSHEDFMNILRNRILPHVLALLSNVQAVTGVVLSALNSGSSTPTSVDPWQPVVVNSGNQQGGVIVSLSYQQQITSSCRNIVSMSCDNAHTLCGKIFEARKEAHSRLPCPQFASFYKTTTQFASQIEHLTGVTCAPLTSAVLAQCKYFLEVFHNKEVNKVMSSLQNESWSAAIVSDSFQQYVDAIVSYNLELGNKPSGNNSQPALRVGTKQFKVTSSVLVLCKSLYDYLCLPSHIPPLAVDIVPKIVQILQSFNSRTHKLMLGAEVTQLLKIKSINAKLLALTSQTVSALNELVPYLRSALQKQLSASQSALIVLLDSVSSDLASHNDQLLNKFVAILKERAQAHFGEPKSLSSWYSQESSSAIGTSPAMSQLCKEISSLHRILSGLLPPDTLAIIFTRTSAMLNADLVEYLTKLETIPNCTVSYQKISQDVEALIAVVKAIPNVTIDDTLTAWVVSHL